jgi:rhodanese-related sulfurtransferase
MRHISLYAAVAGLTAACVTPAPQQNPETSGLEEHRQPLAAVASQWLSDSQEPHHVGSRSDDPTDRSRAPSSLSQPAQTVEAAAAQAIAQLIEEEGLLVLDLETAPHTTGQPQSTVLITVLYGTGRSHPAEASYLVELDTTGGTWNVVSVEPVP